MAFLDFIADWADSNIPIVGSYIAELVRKIQSAIEDAYDWLKGAVNWIENTWIPWAQNLLNDLSDSISNIWDEINYTILTGLNGLKSSLDWLKDRVESLWNDLEDTLNNFADMVWNALPQWLKDGASKALDEIPRIWDSLKQLANSFQNWMDNKERWFLEQLNGAKSTVKGWIHEVTDALSTWAHQAIESITNELHSFENEARQKIASTASELGNKLSALRDWAEEKVNGLTDAVGSIDEYLLQELTKYIVKLAMWFTASFIEDLANLQYDPVTKQVYGHPKNPITVLLVKFVEVEMPDNPYKSVKPKMGIKDEEAPPHGSV